MIRFICEQTIGSLVETALQIADERARLLERLKEAYLSGNDELAKQLGKQLCGIEDDGRTH